MLRKTPPTSRVPPPVMPRARPLSGAGPPAEVAQTTWPVELIMATRMSLSPLESRVWLPSFAVRSKEPVIRLLPAGSITTAWTRSVPLPPPVTAPSSLPELFSRATKMSSPPPELTPSACSSSE